MATVLEPRATLGASGRGPDRWLAGAAGTLVGSVAAGLAAAYLVAGLRAFDGFIERFHLFALTAVLAFAAVAVILGRRGRARPLGRRALAIAAGFALTMLLDRYAAVGWPRDWPGTTWAAWSAAWLWVPAMWAIPTLVLLRFPDGDLVSPAWRPAEVAAWVAVAGEAMAFAFAPFGRIDAQPVIPVANPLAYEPAIALHTIATVLALAAVAAAVASFAARVRRARRDERPALAWVLVGTVASVTVVGVSVASGVSSALVPSLGMALLPTALVVAVVRHGLWGFEVALQRSVRYGLLTALILVVYIVTVGALGGVLGRTVGAPLVATALVAVGFQPLRDRIQRLANQVVYGHRDDPYEVISSLVARLDVAADRHRVFEIVAATVVAALRLDGAAVTVGGDVVATVGDLAGLPERIPLSVRGDEVGSLLIAPRPGESLTTRDHRLLADLTRHVAAAVQAERLGTELAASRARLVAAREEERRRIRRDLHDELAPTLAAIGHEVERAALDPADDRGASRARLEATAARVRGAVRSVRALVDDLRPPALDELGLEGCIRDLARALTSSSGPTIAHSVDVGSAALPAAVDVAAYRIIAEAVTNAVRHADARRVEIRVERAPTALLVEVRDDGTGLPLAPRPGVGLPSIRARAEELGGSFHAERGPDGGTVVTARLPVQT